MVHSKRIDYEQNIHRVLSYIHKHIHETFHLKELASIGQFSPFHFHRIFTAYFGEPLATYIRRSRHEKAAQLLLFSNMAVAEIADSIGYSELSSFSDAFGKSFKMSPSEYRQHHIQQMKKRNHEKSSKLNLNEEPEIVNLDPMKLLTVRSFGSYQSESIGQSWKSLFEFASANSLLNPQTKLYGIAHSNPDITENHRQEYSACINIQTEIKPQGRFGIMEMPEGKYARFTFKGPKEQFPEVYNYIFKDWLLLGEYELRDAEVFDQYLNSPMDTSPDQLATTIHIPLL